MHPWMPQPFFGGWTGGEGRVRSGILASPRPPPPDKSRPPSPIGFPQAQKWVTVSVLVGGSILARGPSLSKWILLEEPQGTRDFVQRDFGVRRAVNAMWGFWPMFADQKCTPQKAA